MRFLAGFSSRALPHRCSGCPSPLRRHASDEPVKVGRGYAGSVRRAALRLLWGRRVRLRGFHRNSPQVQRVRWSVHNASFTPFERAKAMSHDMPAEAEDPGSTEEGATPAEPRKRRTGVLQRIPLVRHACDDCFSKARGLLRPHEVMILSPGPDGGRAPELCPAQGQQGAAGQGRAEREEAFLQVGCHAAAVPDPGALCSPRALPQGLSCPGLSPSVRKGTGMADSSSGIVRAARAA